MRRRFHQKVFLTTKRLQFSNGFSLVEVMVTMFIFSILVTGLYASLAAGENSWQVNKTKMELQQELRKAVEWMKYDLQEAGSGSITNVPADGAWYSTITFKTPDGVTSSGAINWSSDTTQFILAGTNSNELHRIIGSTTKILAQSISSLHFRRQSTSSEILEVGLIAQKDTDKGISVSSQLMLEVQLRN